MATLINACYYALSWVGQKLALPYFTGALVYKYTYNMLPTDSFLSDYLQRWSRDDLITISRKMTSLSCSRLICSVNFLKRALILTSDYGNNVPDSDLDRQLNFMWNTDPTCSRLWDAELSERIKGLLSKAEAWAAEVFYDKSNVNLEGRVEALKVQFLCVLILHKHNQAEILSLWRTILDDVMLDKEIISMINQKASSSWGLFSNEQKDYFDRPLTIRPLLTFIDRLQSTLITYQDDLMANQALNGSVVSFWNTMLTLSPLQGRQIVEDYCVMLTVPTNQFCLLANNRLCTVGQTVGYTATYKELCLRILFNNRSKRELNVGRKIHSVDNLIRYTVAYDPKRDAILLVSSTCLTLYSTSFDTSQPLVQYEFDDFVGYNNKTVLCSQNGVWMILDEILCKLYVKWYKNGACQWKNINIDELDPKKSNIITLMDIRDVKIRGEMEYLERECVEVLLKINKGNDTKFFLSKILKSECKEESSVSQEINVENTPTSSKVFNTEDCLVPFCSYSSQWMTFERHRGINDDTLVLLRTEDETNIKITRLTVNGMFLTEYQIICSLPDGIRQAVFNMPYLFVANKLHPVL